MKEAKKLLVEAGYDKTRWGARIILAEKRHHFTGKEANKGSDWISCACGELDSHIEMMPYEDDGPADRQLNDLGVCFGRHVYNDEFLLAARTLIAIEERSVELLRELA